MAARFLGLLLAVGPAGSITISGLADDDRVRSACDLSVVVVVVAGCHLDRFACPLRGFHEPEFEQADMARDLCAEIGRSCLVWNHE